MGLGYTLSEELRFRGGDILDRNFDTYDIPRFSWVPRIECVFIKNDDLAPQGGGEPPITTTGAVIANALFDATGARMSHLPMSAVRIKTAIGHVTAGRRVGSLLLANTIDASSVSQRTDRQPMDRSC